MAKLLHNRYQLNRLLSQGGMGAIHDAYDTTMQKRVAIKENFLAEDTSTEQFKREALILGNLHHPSLPRVTDHFVHSNKQYLVMDYVDGDNLLEMVKKRGRPLSEDEAIRYIIQICDTLSYLHTQTPPIVHRDIKPQNIKITPQGLAVLVDFGISKQSGAGDKTMAGARGVTPGFSPPEQHFELGTTAQSDIYALGATFYALLTGKKPPDSASLYNGHRTFTPPDVLNPNLSPAISETIQWAMALDAKKRPPSAQIWKDDLIAISTATRLSSSTEDAPTAKEKTFYLVDVKGRQYPLSGQPLTVGRQSGNDIHLKSDGKVSRRHASIQLNKQTCIVKDLGSSNGTSINGRRIGAKGMPLKEGDTLKIGDTKFQLKTVLGEVDASLKSSTGKATSRLGNVSTSATTEDMGGIAGMTQMLTVQIAQRMEGMSAGQVAALIGGVILVFGLGTWLVNDFVQQNIPWFWSAFNPIFYVAGPLVYIFSRRRGVVAGVHLVVYMLIVFLTWGVRGGDLMLPFLAGLGSGLVLEGSFFLANIPVWLRFPAATTLAYMVNILILTQSASLAFFANPGYIGVFTAGIILYVINEAYRGYQRARALMA